MNQLYRVIGVSKQSVHQHEQRSRLLDLQLCELIAAASTWRKQHPGCGVEKLYYALSPSFIGRDRFIELMMDAGFRLKTPRNCRRTTYAGTWHYPNRIKGLRINAPCTVWQSDLTYVEAREGFCYAVFIVDVYTKKLVGYELSTTMHATANLKALAMALKSNPAPKIHHSDRGSQYGSHGYTDMLKQAGVQVSMGLTAQDNAYAERINRTIKEEYLSKWKGHSFKKIKTELAKAAQHYNNKRPHNHLNRATPAAFEQKCLNDQSFHKPTITIFNENNLLKTVNVI